jgi:hypothetical protein
VLVIVSSWRTLVVKLEPIAILLIHIQIGLRACQLVCLRLQLVVSDVAVEAYSKGVRSPFAGDDQSLPGTERLVLTQRSCYWLQTELLVTSLPNRLVDSSCMLAGLVPLPRSRSQFVRLFPDGKRWIVGRRSSVVCTVRPRRLM